MVRTSLIALILFSFPAIGQNLFDIGLKGGLNRDDLTTTYAHDPLLGGNLGVFARVKPPIFPGVQGEVLVSSLGSHVTVEGYDADLRTVSVQLPLFMVLALGQVELYGGGY